MRYEIIIKPAAEKSLDRISKPHRTRIADALEGLRNNPRPPGVLKMSGRENLWRIRIGDYRVVYEIHDNRLIVLVLRGSHRKAVYRGGRM
jgi:mRNA interferase RelE/StbE